MRKKEINSNYDLMKGFRAGQQKSFTEVFNLLYPSLCYYSFNIINDQAAAEDLVEDSFIKIWERREIFLKITVLKSYLYTTVRNASINWIKQNRICYSSENIDQLIITDENDYFHNLLKSEVYNNLSSELDKLSPQSKQIIMMIYFEGKDTRCVADELGVSQSTVKTQRGRSLSKLKKGLLQ